MANSLAALTLGDAAVRQLDGLFSLNDLHAAAGGASKHQPAFFLRRQETQALIDELSHSANSQSGLRVVNGGTAPGTYACRELVIAYAAWISAAFHLRVIRVFLAAAPVPASVLADAQALAVAHTRAIEAAQAAAARVRRSVYRSMQQTPPGATLRMLVEVYPDESGDPHITARRLADNVQVLTPAELAQRANQVHINHLRAELAAALEISHHDR